MFLENTQPVELDAFHLATLAEHERTGGRRANAERLLLSAWARYDRDFDDVVVVPPSAPTPIGVAFGPT